MKYLFSIGYHDLIFGIIYFLLNINNYSTNNCTEYVFPIWTESLKLISGKTLKYY